MGEILNYFFCIFCFASPRFASVTFENGVILLWSSVFSTLIFTSKLFFADAFARKRLYKTFGKCIKHS